MKTDTNYLDRRILVIDDEVAITEMIRVYFHMEGYTNVKTLNNCACTIDEVCESIGEADLLVTDLHMPKILESSDEAAGFQILLNIQQKQLPTTVFVVSGNPSSEVRIRAREFGAHRVFFKPIDFKEMMSEAKKVLEEK